MRAIWRVLGLAGFVAAVLLATLLPQGIWTAALVANLRTGIATPWCVPAALGLLWLGWRFAGGQWPWRSEARRTYRRANAVQLPVMAWALLANIFAIAALAALWILLRELVAVPGNPSPDFSAYPVPVTAAILSCAGLIGGVTEEVGLRGYLQQRLERRLPWPLAIALTALVAAPAHAATQGFVWPTMLFYLFADATYGVTATLTKSVIPGIVAHALGLIAFFAFVWPYDHARRVVSLASAGSDFWGLAAAMLVLAGLAIWAFARLAKVAHSDASRHAIATGAAYGSHLTGFGHQAVRS